MTGLSRGKPKHATPPLLLARASNRRPLRLGIRGEKKEKLGRRLQNTPPPPTLALAPREVTRVAVPGLIRLFFSNGGDEGRSLYKFEGGRGIPDGPLALPYIAPAANGFAENHQKQIPLTRSGIETTINIKEIKNLSNRNRVGMWRFI